MIGDKPLTTGQTLGSALLERPAQAAQVLREFRIGQVLNARVLPADSSGQLRLISGDQVLKTPLSSNLFRAGDLLSLQVTGLGQQPALKLLSTPTPLIDTQSLQLAALRQLLPKQGSLNDLFQQLSSLMQNGSNSEALPQPLRDLLQKGIPPEQINKETLKELFRNSGLFMESQLASNKAEGGDLKAILLRLLSLLQPASSNSTANSAALQRWLADSSQLDQQQRLLDALQKATEGALAKLELRQLNSLQQKEEGRLVWQLGLPIGQEQHAREVEITIERDQQRSATETAESWSVNLHFDFEETGPMDVRIQLQGEQLRTLFWAGESSTLGKIERLLPQLRDNLQRAGFQVQPFGLYLGSAPKKMAIPLEIQGRRLLDERV